MTAGGLSRGSRLAGALRGGWLPLLATATVALATWHAFNGIRETDDDAVRRWSQIQSQATAQAMRSRAQIFELAFERMARRQEARPDPEVWRVDATRYREDFPAIEGITWHAEDHSVLVTSPPELASMCVPSEAQRPEFWKGMLDAARQARLFWKLVQAPEKLVLCAYTPLASSDRRGDYLAAVADPRTTLQNYLPSPDPGIAYQVAIGSQTIFSRGDPDAAIFREFAKTYELEIGALSIDISTGPSREKLAELRPPTAGIVLVSGHLLAILLGFAVAANGRARRRAVELAVARDAAEAANRAKSTFLANMSHEVRTPLNAIIGLTEVVLRGELGRQQREHLETVMLSSETLLTVLNDILDFSKIEAGKLDLERAPFDLHESVGRTLEIFAILAQRKGLELACLISPEAPTSLVGDATRLRQVISNLLSNAIKFTKQGSVVLRVQPVRGGDEPVLMFSVTDTGVGVDPEQGEALFDSFEQADPSTTRRYGGSGLGLTICRQLVALMGGEIGVESAPGAGSTFHFSARFGLGDETAESRDAAKAALAGVRVLIVDDVATNREILEVVVASAGMRATCTASAGEALEALEGALRANDPFGLMLSDYHMPGMDGLELCRRIRGEPRFDPLEVLLLTSADPDDSPEGAEGLRLAGRIRKPVRQLVLLEHMARAMEGMPLTAGAESRGHDDSEAQGPRLRILLAEDGLANQKVAIAMLGPAHEIVVAETGRRAIELVASREFDLVLMDVEMPEMDGISATEAIRSMEQGSGRRTPIVGMTAHATGEARNRCIQSGMDDYLAKPVRRRELLTVVRRATAGSGDGELAGGDAGLD